MINIAIFASGGGSNAAKIIGYFENNNHIKVALIVTNNPKAGIVQIAAVHQIPIIAIDKTSFFQTENLLGKLSAYKIDYIILAGFLWLVPKYLIHNYSNKILNIHPALLPSYGGKGMYGHHVHEAVKINGDEISGMSIHLVNEKYDEGDIIFQATCPITSEMTAEDIASEVLKLEHLHYSRVIEDYISSLNELKSM